MNKIFIYADGGCRGNQYRKNVGGYGVYIKYKNYEKEIKGSTKNTTNNIMELTSCIEGLKAIKNKDIPVEVIMDSSYVINGITNWIYSWINNNWKSTKGKQVENKKLWEELYSLKNEYKNIVFIKCKGHSNNEGNNIADKLANEAMNTLIKN